MNENYETRADRPQRMKLPNFVAGLVVGVLVAGGVAPLVGGERSTSSNATPDFLAGPSSSGSTGETGGTADGSAPALVESTPGASSATGTAGATAGATAGSSAANNVAGPTASAADEPRKASDIGITDSVIRVGAANLNCKACAAFGINTTQQRDITQAFVDDINQRGGINGRKIEHYSADYDPAEDAANGGGTERELCIELTKNRKVFAVVLGVVWGNPCIYQENKTPLLTFGDLTAEDPDSFNRSEGRLWLTGASNGRILLDFARQLDRQQLITKSTKWGLVDAEGDEHGKITRYFLAELKRLGYTPTHVSTLGGDLASLNVKIAQEVTAMRSKGVTHVVLATTFLGSQFWVREASRNGWKPQYRFSDFPAPTNDFAGGQISAGGDITGAIALSMERQWTLDEARRDPAAKPCIDTYERVTGRKTGEDLGNVLAICAIFGTFEQAMRNAGANPTRRSYVSALANLGQFRVLGTMGGVGRFGGAYSLGATKWSASDYAERRVWRKPCPRPGDSDNQCWVPEGSVYRMAA